MISETEIWIGNQSSRVALKRIAGRGVLMLLVQRTMLAHEVTSKRLQREV